MFRHALIATATVLGLAAAASAQPLPETKLVAGTIVSADAATRTIEVKTGDHTQSFTLAEDAKLEAGKKSLQAADLANVTGQRVTVWYKADGDSRVAGRVKVTEIKGTATAKAATQTAPATTPE